MFRAFLLTWVSACLATFAGCSPHPSAVALRATPAVAAPKTQTVFPAFLDAFDSITVWVPEFVEPSTMAKRVMVTVAGAQVPISAVKGGKPIGDVGVKDPNKVVIAGSFQHLVGSAGDWSPSDDSSAMMQTASGVYEFVATLPAGNYEYKVAKGGSWDENYGKDFKAGGENIPLKVAGSNTVVKWIVDFNKHSVADSINNPDLVQAPASAPTHAAASDTKTNVLLVKLAHPLTPLDVASAITIQFENQPSRVVYARHVLDSPQFACKDQSLGPRYTHGATDFKVWSPVSDKAELLLYTSTTSAQPQAVAMQKAANGVWSAHVSGDLSGHYYQYSFHSYGETRVAPDINCYAASRDGTRSEVVDLSTTNPAAWPVSLHSTSFAPTDAVLYELHVSDFTDDPVSGVRADWKGKYLGFTQAGTTYDSMPTGIDYLKWLGVNSVHLLPFQMFNPAHTNDYNWGYETNLFNVPEHQYGTKPEDSAQNSREVKAMVAALHRAGIRVVMDVVYNHTVPSEGAQSAFWQTVPYYYFRTDDKGTVLNESGVGNAWNDDAPIARKYVRDSLTFWAREYDIDGFRFDLMGMFEPDSIRDWSKALHAVRSDILIYGEPWTGGGPTRFGKGAQKGTGTAVFNDNFRNAVRGETDGPGLGFGEGSGNTEGMKRGVIGSITDFTGSPTETINYVSAHDNLTLWDKIQLAMAHSGTPTQKAALEFMGAAVLLSEGVPFLEGGAELGRTKGGDNNSYNGGADKNKFDWTRADSFRDVAEQYRALIALRKAHHAFRLRSAYEVRHDVQVLPDPKPGTVEYTITDPSDSWKHILVVLHGGTVAEDVPIPTGSWRFGYGGNGLASGVIHAEPLSAYVLVR